MDDAHEIRLRLAKLNRSELSDLLDFLRESSVDGISGGKE